MIKIETINKKIINKNKISRIIILLIITFGLIFGLYGLAKNTIKNSIIYEVGSISPIGPVTNKVKIKQEINMYVGKFNNISVQMATYGRVNEGDLIFKLYKNGEEIELLSKKINLATLQNNEFVLFNFKTINVSKGEKYYFTIETTASSENKAPAIWQNPKEIDNFSLFINDGKTQGKLCYKVGYEKSYFVLGIFTFICIVATIFIIVSSCFSEELITKKSQALAGLFLSLSMIFIFSNMDLFYRGSQIDFNYFIIVFSLVLYICYFLFYNIKLNKKLNKFYTLSLLFIIPFISLSLIELFNNNLIYKMDLKIVGINYLCVLALYLFLYAITNRIDIALFIGSMIFYIIGLVYYYVLMFRGTPILPTDFYSVKTAASVARHYEFIVDFLVLSTFLVLILIFAICRNLKNDFKRTKIKVYSKIGLIVSIIFFILNANSIFNKAGASINLWQQTVGYQNNGVLVNFIMNMKYLKVDKPESYSTKKVNDIISKFDVNKVSNKNMNANKPNIIAIMNESFSDLSVIGDIKTNQDYMPFFHNLKKDTIKGNLFVSTYGGGTSNTEWEFLTGNSMAFIPSGAIPYQQYIDTPSNSLARTLKALKYDTIAMHPFNGKGWNRDNVYPLLGFDKFITIDDFKKPEVLRNSYISDEENYKKIIEKYKEKNKEDRLFIFNTTIQNHGGYSTENSIFKDSIYLTDYNYSDVNEYLSLIKKSDEALEKLINYFSNQNEPTIILMFGDHLPALNTGFYESLFKKPLTSLTLEEKQKMYKVPFVIWSNYDIEEKYIDRISANYLSSLLLMTANQPLTEYDEFLYELYKKIPVINSNGYIDTNGDNYKINEKKYQDYIDNYRMLQYNNVFDTKNTVDRLFTLSR